LGSGKAYFEYEDQVGAAPVVFGDEDVFLLGATTLEALGLILDPIRRQLKPLPMLLMVRGPEAVEQAHFGHRPNGGHTCRSTADFILAFCSSLLVGRCPTCLDVRAPVEPGSEVIRLLRTMQEA
jgi:hypothetical protein